MNRQGTKTRSGRRACIDPNAVACRGECRNPNDEEGHHFVERFSARQTFLRVFVPSWLVFPRAHKKSSQKSSRPRGAKDAKTFPGAIGRSLASEPTRTNREVSLFDSSGVYRSGAKHPCCAAPLRGSKSVKPSSHRLVRPTHVFLVCMMVTGDFLSDDRERRVGRVSVFRKGKTAAASVPLELLLAVVCPSCVGGEYVDVANRSTAL